ncbi:uncharacterized protein ACMZJ9_015066 [Mantella aurantiaca]
MEERSHMTETILHLTLEIIHLLTGEKCAVVKMVSIEGLLQGMYPPVYGEPCRSPSMDPPPPSLISDKSNDKEILDVIQKMIGLLTGEALLDECRSDWKTDAMEIRHDSPDVSGRAETPLSSSSISEESDPSKERHLFEGGDNIEVDYTLVNVKEEDLLDGDCWTPRSRPPATATEDASRRVTASEFQRRPPVAGVKEELGLNEDPGDPLEKVALWAKSKGVSGNPLLAIREEFSERSQPPALYWPPSQSPETDGCRLGFPGGARALPSAGRGPPLICPECGKCFGRAEELARHRESHVGPKPYSCPQCEKSFWMRSQLKVHRKAHEGGKPFSCAVCGNCFSRRQMLETHMQTHSGERPYMCAECGRSFSRNSLLVVHRRIHSGEKPYSCTECNRSFRHKSALVTHQRTHTGERPYHCSVCGKCYTHSSHLVVHQRSHSGEKPYSCLECGKGFSHKSALVRHQRIHSVK